MDREVDRGGQSVTCDIVTSHALTPFSLSKAYAYVMDRGKDQVVENDEEVVEEVYK